MTGTILLLSLILLGQAPAGLKTFHDQKFGISLELGAIKSNGTVAIGGATSPFFVATYTAADSRGAAVPFAHTQAVVDHGEYYYLISFSGPSRVYETKLPVFEHALESLTFTK